MAIATGPGKAETRTTPPSLLLFNFDIDGDNLKPEHIQFLRTEALPTLRAGGAARVIGLTDRSGSAGHNQELSERRVARTIEFLRTELPSGLNLKQMTGFGEEAAAREGFKDGTTDERFRSVLVFLTTAPDKPFIIKTKVITVTVKSFIALVGSNVGTIPGFTTLPPAHVVPVPRQALLKAMAKAMDAIMDEDPRTIGKDKHYRLFSQCKLTILFEGGTILGTITSPLATDAGKEGPLQAPPLIASPVKVSPTGKSFVTFSWTAKGRPHPAAEPPFQIIHPRTSVFIWHAVEGRIDISSGAPVTTVSLTGSQFPSHRAFLDLSIVANVRQGPFSNLWVSDPADRTMVR
jgi:hypothetical protein